MKQDFIIGNLESAVGAVPLVSTSWSTADIVGTIKVRWSIGRNDYAIKPGLYATGKPEENSNVFVTANYKLSFDHLRRALKGINAWILVINTNGVNVWCAAGKGTFGTTELSNRIRAHELRKIVNHHKVIVPQLGAVGVSAHEVKKQSGFNVVYGPVKASDIKAFVDAGNKATPEMRKITFPFIERLKLIPVELSYGKYYLLLIPALFFLLAGIGTEGYSIDKAWDKGSITVLNLFTAYLAGCVLAPAFLPWIPFKRFSLKGLLVVWIISSLLFYFNLMGDSILENIAYVLINGAIASFLAMNFTGTSTYTSLSGVQKEMKTALPLQIAASAIGIIIWIVTLFV